MGRHGFGWAVAGALVGLMDAVWTIARPGTESLSGSVLASALTLNVVLHIIFGAMIGLVLGRVLVLTVRVAWGRFQSLSVRLRRRLMLTVAALSGVVTGLGWVGVGQWIEWDAVDWRLPMLLSTLPAVGFAASELPRRPRQLMRAVGVLVVGAVAGMSLWVEGSQSTGDAAARLGEDAASGRWLVAVARDALDKDADGFPAALCAGDCDCDDRRATVYPGAAEVVGNDVDEDCDGRDLSDEATAIFAELMTVGPSEVAPPPAELAAVELVRDLSWMPAGVSRVYGAAPFSVSDEDVTPARRNILFITVDTLRADHLGLYGYAKPTSPNLDRLAERCAVFDQARATGSQTRFSVPPMVTGKYFTEIARTEGKWPVVLPEEDLIAEQLRDAGYHTAAFHSLSYLQGRFGFSQGFDHYDTSVLKARPKTRFKPTSDYITDQTLAYVDDARFTSREGSPFFIWAYYSDPHSPYIFHRGFPSFGPWMKDVYDNEIAYTDHHVGRLIDGMASRGLLENTLIVLTSDHGEGLDEADDHGHRYHGPNLHDEVVRVPLMVCGAGVTPGRVPTSVSLIDLPPTFLEVADVSPSPEHRGVSLQPWLQGQMVPHPPVFFEKHKDIAFRQKGMVMWPYKVILKMAYNKVQIYDLARDPRERQDLQGTIDPDTRARLVGLLNHWAHDVLEVRKPEPIQTAQRP